MKATNIRNSSKMADLLSSCETTRVRKNPLPWKTLMVSVPSFGSNRVY